MSHPPPTSQRFDLGDPYTELLPVTIVFVVLLSLWYLLPNLEDSPLSAEFWAQVGWEVAWSALIIISYLILRAWLFSPRRWYAELTPTELVVRTIRVTLRIAYPNIQRVARHDPGWRRTLAAFRALFGRPALPACMQVELGTPIRRTLFLRTRRLLLRPHETALFLRALHERAPTTPIVT